MCSSGCLIPNGLELALTLPKCHCPQGGWILSLNSAFRQRGEHVHLKS